MMASDAYRCYLALKNHFTKDKYDYHKYRGKVRATNQAFYKRKDRFWFEKFARQQSDKEVEEYFFSNFIYSTDPGTMWIGEMIKEGEGRYVDLKKKIQQNVKFLKYHTNPLQDKTRKIIHDSHLLVFLAHLSQYLFLHLGILSW